MSTPREKIYTIQSAVGGSAPSSFKFRAEGDNIEFDEASGEVFKTDKTSAGFSEVKVFAVDQDTNLESPAGIFNYFSSEEDPLSAMASLPSIDIVLEGVSLCPGECTVEQDYTEYKDFGIGPVQSFSLTQTSSSASEVIWQYDGGDNAYWEWVNVCGENEYWSAVQSITPVPLAITVSLKDSPSEGYFEFKILVNDGKIFHHIHEHSEPYSQISSERYDNDNIMCHETYGIVGSGGTASITYLTCFAPPPIPQGQSSPITVTPDVTAVDEPDFSEGSEDPGE